MLLRSALALKQSPRTRISRELARDMGKEIEFTTKGTEIEVDRRILEEIKDPVTHIIRNCIDHGIETPEERKKKDKPPRGKLHIQIRQIDGNKIVLTISDDGEGFNKNKILNKALKMDMISKQLLMGEYLRKPSIDCLVMALTKA